MRPQRHIVPLTTAARRGTLRPRITRGEPGVDHLASRLLAEVFHAHR